jgi:hypothetical protein
MLACEVFPLKISEQRMPQADGKMEDAVTIVNQTGIAF